jgi:hypothetical protein
MKQVVYIFNQGALVMGEKEARFESGLAQSSEAASLLPSGSPLPARKEERQSLSYWVG